MSVTPSAPPDASGTVRGLVNLAAQTFAGVKTFLALIVASAGIEIAAATALTVTSGTMTLRSGASTIATITNLGQLSVVEVTASGATNGYILGGTRVLFNGASNTNFSATAGLSAALGGPLGAGANDVVAKAGSTVADASVNATAKVFSVRTGLGGTEVEKLYIDKAGDLWTGGGVAGQGVFRGAGNGNQFLQCDTVNGVRGFLSGFSFSLTGSGFTAITGGAGTARFDGSARLDQSGTDTTGTPGAATINKPTGKSAIAAGASSVVITNSLVTAASIVLITPHARDATCKELIAVPAAGSFTVSGSANATAAVPFSFEVKTIL